MLTVTHPTPPYTVHIGHDLWPHGFDDYTTALAAFTSTAAEESDERQVTLCQYSAAQRTVWLVSLANPFPPRNELWANRDEYREMGFYVPPRPAKPVWTNLFAGLTLSPLFHLSPATRSELAALKWPAPPDAVSWTYAEPTEIEPTPEATTEPGAAPATKEAIALVESLDLDAYAADPACRVDATALRRRLLLNWTLDRAMSTPMIGYQTGESPTYYDAKTRRVRTLPFTQRHHTDRSTPNN